MSTYKTRLIEHLATYKEVTLEVQERGTFLHRGRELQYRHILPKELRWLNILEPFRAGIRMYLEGHSKIKLHKYFHHLNSSQAFALNVFWPFFELGSGTRLLYAMGLPAEFSGWEPEHIADKEEGTNVDVAWWSGRGDDQRWVYCEVKLSEEEFGAAASDDRHRKKLKEIYRPVLEPYLPPEMLTEGQFFARYQILRNIWLAARNARSAVVFFLPEGNVRLWGPLRDVIGTLVPELQSRVHLVGMESVLERLSKDEVCSWSMHRHVERLIQKYVPASA